MAVGNLEINRKNGGFFLVFSPFVRILKDILPILDPWRCVMFIPPALSPENSTPSEADQALKKAVAMMEEAQHAAVIWFGEILRRGLFRTLGHSTIYQYAEVELK